MIVNSKSSWAGKTFNGNFQGKQLFQPVRVTTDAYIIKTKHSKIFRTLLLPNGAALVGTSPYTLYNSHRCLCNPV